MLLRRLTLGAAFAGALGLAGTVAQAAEPQILSGPSADPKCYVPWSEQTKFFQFPE